MLSSLEADLGMKLATRSKSGIRLTPAGEELLEGAQLITKQWSRTKMRLEALSAKGEDTEGRLEVFTTHYGMHVISQLGSTFEGLSDYDLHEESFDKILARVMNAGPNEAFIADVFDDASLSDMQRRGIAFEPIYESVVGLLVRDDCPLAQFDAVSPDDLSTLKMACYMHKEWNRLMESVLENRNRISTFFESSAFNLIMGFVRAAPDRGVLTDSLAVYGSRKNRVHNLTGLRFIPLKATTARLRLGALSRQNEQASPKIMETIGRWREYAQTEYADYFDELARVYRIIGI